MPVQPLPTITRSRRILFGSLAKRLINIDLSDVVKMDICVLSSREQIESFQSKWLELLSKSNCHKTFSSPQWYFNTLKAFPELTPRLVVVEQDGALMGLAPCVLNSEQDLMFVSDLADYQDIIIRPNDYQTARSLFDALLSDKLGGKKVRLSGLSKQANLHLVLDEQLDVKQIEQCFFSDLSQGYDAFMQQKSAKFRSNLRRIHRRAKENDIKIVELTPNECSGDAVVTAFLRLHLKRYPDKLFSRDKPQSFCHINLKEQFQNRLLRVFALLDQKIRSESLSDKIIALNLSVCDSDVLGIWNGGFDPKYTQISPGKLLVHKQIQTCCEEGLKGFDFLRGDESYKQDWSTSVRVLSEFTAQIGR